MPEGYVEVNPEVQWCERHWFAVLDTMDGPDPVNGLMATILIFKEWMTNLAETMGKDFPTQWETERATELFLRDAPLCCLLGDERLAAIYSACIVPERFRAMDIRSGHTAHLQEETGAMIVTVHVGEDVSFVLPPPNAGLN